VRFQIDNFRRERMLQIRDEWPEIKRSLDLAASLLDQFGLIAVNLNARSVIHPLAYYIKHRGLDASYLTAKGSEVDREAIRQWALRSLLRQGIWGSGLDTLLTRLRTTIKQHGADHFPVAEIDQMMSESGKGLAFDADSVEGLLLLRYGERNCFALLSLIYPGNEPMRRHVDHVYPRTAFTRAKLAKLGLPDEEVAWMLAASREVPNLQLLTPADNESKGGRFPAPWLESAFPDAGHRAAVAAFHHFGEIGASPESFREFFEERRKLLAGVIRERLGVTSDVSSVSG
jgi:hypothetical protein